MTAPSKWWLIVHTLWNQLLLELSLDLFNTLKICCRHIEDVHEEVWWGKNIFWQTVCWGINTKSYFLPSFIRTDRHDQIELCRPRSDCSYSLIRVYTVCHAKTTLFKIKGNYSNNIRCPNIWYFSDWNVGHREKGVNRQQAWEFWRLCQICQTYVARKLLQHYTTTALQFSTRSSE